MHRVIACKVDFFWRGIIFIPSIFGSVLVWDLLEGHEAKLISTIRKIIQWMVTNLAKFDRHHRVLLGLNRPASEMAEVSRQPEG